ncbi:aspartyl/asparaginyl beta-hydroxylase domain-containing protein [Ideonella paludis]|uniref:aspartyl/asparaginyl beta-hydroxylase domain-containing protein n=1 Tax=Ideonella paludis TaxID=1233411 RepID=UPI0036350937
MFRQCLALANSGDFDSASGKLLAYWGTTQRLAPDSWLLLGHIEQRRGQQLKALKAWFRAIDQAQRQGRWLNEQSTEPELLPMVLSAMDELQHGKRQWLLDQLSDLRREYGSDGLKRVDRALTNYLGESQDGPQDFRQRPKFLYIPGLPDSPYHDPYLQPWAEQLAAAFPDIQEEAIALLNKEGVFESFLTFGPGADRSAYVGGEGDKPSWDAFFFYRRGRRFDANHLRCPKTSALLDSIELCRIKSQAPEVCFSVLAPGSHIKPHYGVTNSRLVLHLPLLVPQDCALNVIDAGAHAWKEGQLMMFDDTFQHEAWNRSNSTRIILLMDCWNPHLTNLEKSAITRLVESISDFESEY